MLKDYEKCSSYDISCLISGKLPAFSKVQSLKYWDIHTAQKITSVILVQFGVADRESAAGKSG